MLSLIVMCSMVLCLNIVSLIKALRLNKEDKDRKARLLSAGSGVISLTGALVLQICMYLDK